MGCQKNIHCLYVNENSISLNRKRFIVGKFGRMSPLIEQTEHCAQPVNQLSDRQSEIQGAHRIQPTADHHHHTNRVIAKSWSGGH